MHVIKVILHLKKQNKKTKTNYDAAINLEKQAVINSVRDKKHLKNARELTSAQKMSHKHSNKDPSHLQ